MIRDSDKRQDLILRFATKVAAILRERIAENVVSVCLFGSAGNFDTNFRNNNRECLFRE